MSADRSCEAVGTSSPVSTWATSDLRPRCKWRWARDVGPAGLQCQIRTIRSRPILVISPARIDLRRTMMRRMNPRAKRRVWSIRGNRPPGPFPILWRLDARAVTGSASTSGACCVRPAMSASVSQRQTRYHTMPPEQGKRRPAPRISGKLASHPRGGCSRDRVGALPGALSCPYTSKLARLRHA